MKKRSKKLSLSRICTSRVPSTVARVAAAFEKALYVLHAFMKKSKSGIGLPKPDAALIKIRLQRARELDKED